MVLCHIRAKITYYKSKGEQHQCLLQRHYYFIVLFQKQKSPVFWGL